MSELNRLVTMFLDYAENKAKKQIPMKMVDWIKKIDRFLEFNEYNILEGLGTISKESADKKVISEYEMFRINQDKNYKSDFDRLIEGAKSFEKK